MTNILGGSKRADAALLLALACGATVENAARKAGMSERTAHRRLADPSFRQQLSQVRNDMVERATGMMTAAALEAVKTLLALQDTAIPAAARLGAARAVIELGLKLREENNLGERLAALEEQMAAHLRRG